MTAPHTYITTTIPYVNARPHIGFALELVQADVLARYRRGRGDAVRFQAGTDDNSLKNVLAAEAAGVEVQEFVDHNAEAFVALGDALSLTVDDVIRTSRDPRHRPGVDRFWRACSADLYRQRYEGRARPAATGGCRVLPRCSGGCRQRRRQGVVNRQARVPAGCGSAG